MAALAFCMFGFLAWLAWQINKFLVPKWTKPDTPRRIHYFVSDIAWRSSTIPMIFFDAAKEYKPHSCPKFAATLIEAERLVRYLRSQEPFCLSLGGRSMYILTSLRDVSGAFRDTSNLSFEMFYKELLSAFGCSKSSVEKICSTKWKGHENVDKQNNPKSLDLASLVMELFASQFLPGPKLDAFANVVLADINVSLDPRDSPTGSRCHIANGSGKPFRLRRWVGNIINDSVMHALLGSNFMRMNPDIGDTFVDFNVDGWRLIFKYPRWAAPKLHAQRDLLIGALQRHFESPKSDRADQSWLITRLEAEARLRGLENKDIASMCCMVLWGVASNAYKICFWLLAHLLFDQRLYDLVRDETGACFSGGCQDPDLTRLISRCPRLDASWHECLRLGSASASVRHVNKTCVINGKRYEEGGQIMIPISQLHHGADYFGRDPDSFDADRFYNDPCLVKSPAYRPWGGGTTYCPGRYVAKLEIFYFIALALNRFNLSLSDEDDRGYRVQQKRPAFDMKSPCMGVRNSIGDADVWVRLAPESEGGRVKQVARKKVSVVG
ncbi:hypothetical protein FKW77_000278 [Venturia effusa]|uniref:Cytochrome P450 n=1 Tax=Venturia effusa TaxID=50376 RepID=A0A517L2K5_9PEZI|nr:hypothetical protein FKW77_000278 [Venturia effusa]